ncbi:MAG: extracellular solute-binding protein [Salaquimonas sp.]
MRFKRKHKTRSNAIAAFAGILAIGLMIVPGLGIAACLNPNNVELTINLPNYPFWKNVVSEMEQCGNVKASFEFDATSVTTDAIAPDRDLGAMVGVSNASLYRLSKQNLLRPLDDLAEKYKGKLHPRQIIRIDGKVVAIAVAANTRALMVHEELFNQEKITIPKDYHTFLASGEKLKGSQLYTHSFSLAFKGGWNLTQEFVDQFLAAGGKWLDDANNPSVSDEIGIATLERMKKLAEYLPEDHMEADSARVLDDLLKFRAPMSVLWSSSAGPLDNPAVSRVAGKMAILPAPSVVSDGKPASTLWWDGFAIPISATNEQAEAAFVTALEGLDAEMLEKHRDSAFWLVKDYAPGRLTKNLLAELDKNDGQGITRYPASEATDLLRRALGPRLTEFMEGKVGAATALSIAEADYLRAARERGLIGS